MVDVCGTSFTLEEVRQHHTEFRMKNPGACDDFIAFVDRYYIPSSFEDGTYIERSDLEIGKIKQSPAVGYTIGGRDRVQAPYSGCYQARPGAQYD